MKFSESWDKNVSVEIILSELIKLTDLFEECSGECDTKAPHIKCDVCLACSVVNDVSLFLRKAHQKIRNGKVAKRVPED